MAHRLTSAAVQFWRLFSLGFAEHHFSAQYPLSGTSSPIGVKVRNWDFSVVS